MKLGIMIFKSTNDVEGALYHLTKALESNSKWIKSEGYYNIGVIYHNEGKYE